MKEAENEGKGRRENQGKGRSWHGRKKTWEKFGVDTREKRMKNSGSKCKVR